MASISFDGTELANATYTPRFAKHESAPQRQIASVPLAREDGEIFIGERYGRKIIQLSGIITGSSQADLEQKMDAFKELLSRPEKDLDIDWGGGTRRYVATCSDGVRFDRDHFHLLFCPWSAELVVLTGEGKDTATTTVPEADGTTGTHIVFTASAPTTDGQVAVTIAGGKAPRPVITLSDLDFGTGPRGIEYKNEDTGERLVITYPGGWGNDRTVTIDCDAKTVVGDVVNGITKALGFYGVFPRFAIGTNNVRVTPGFIVNQKSADDSTADLSTSDSVLINSTAYYKAQGFMVPYADQTFSGVKIAAQKVGSPGTLRWRIETDNGGKPSGTLVDAANSFGTFASAGTSADYLLGEPSTYAPFTLAANTQYWLVIYASATLDGSNYYQIPFPLETTYPRGKALYSNNSGGLWEAFSSKKDLPFRILFGGRQATATMKHKIEYRKTYL